MAFAFRYPMPGGTGASSGSILVTACGEFDPFSEGGAVSIWGKVYRGSSTPTDPTPPATASRGTCVTSGSSCTWHFNSCSPPLLDCDQSGPFVMRVWLTSSAVSFFLFRDCPFTGCVSGSGDCVPDCPALAPQAPTDLGPVIADCASRYFLAVPAPGLAQLLDVFGVPGAVVDKLAILLKYDEVRSTFDRAIWSSDVIRGDQLRLEVTHGNCCLRAFLGRVRITKQKVCTLERWAAECFDIVQGGPLHALAPDGQWCEGGVLLKPPPEPIQATPQVLAAAATPTKKSSRRRGRR